MTLSLEHHSWDGEELQVLAEKRTQLLEEIDQKLGISTLMFGA